ncbi:MAG: tol-pal system protein YbgF [Pseudomonadota bacterium]
MNKITYPILLAAFVAQAAGAATPEEQTQQLVELQKAAQAQDERIGRLERQLQNQGLLNLLNQVESLKAEVARLRGAQEEQAHQQTTADKRAKELFADLDDRVKELESRPAQSAAAPPPSPVRLQAAQSLTTPAPAAAPAAPVAGDAESAAYEAAHNLVKAGRYKEAVLALQGFVKNYPSSGLAPNAHYWTGFSYVGMSDFESAAASYQHLIKEYPRSPKAADAMLSLARAQVQMNVQAEAIATLEQLIAKFPYSRAAENGKKLLATLK